MATSSVISVIIGFAAFCNNGALSSPDFLAEQMTKQIESCDFDSSLCGYTPSPADDSWLVIQGSYPLHYARYPRIPPQNHDGRYLVPDINNKYIDVAITFSLTSPFITSGLIFIEFEYALQSLESTLRLSVKNTKNDDVTTVWETSNEEGGKWKRQTAVISSSDPFQITFQTSKKSDRGAVGIDDVRIWKVAPTSFGSSRPPVLETTINGISFPELISTTAKPTTTQGTPLTDQITMLSNVAELCGVHNPHTLPQGCDFGTDFCNYTHQPDTVWLRNNAIYPSGFAIGHIPVSPNGTYAVPNFVHFTSLINDNIATLTSPPINSGVICVEFLYSLQWHYSNLEVFAGNARLWQAPPYTCTSRQWTTHTLAVKSSGPFQLQFMSRKINVHGSVGIDSIQVWESFIPTTSTAAPTTSTTPNMSVTTTAPEATTHSSVTPSTTRSTNTSRTTTPSSTATLSTTSPTTKPPPITTTAPPTTPTAPPTTTTAPPTTPTAPPTTPRVIVPPVTITSNVAELCGVHNPHTLPQGCDFGTDFCNYTHQPDTVWLRNNAMYPSGFAIGHIPVSPNGTYAVPNFVHFNSFINDAIATLTSPPINSGVICVEFLYSLQGRFSNLEVFAGNTSLWQAPEHKSTQWTTHTLAVKSSDPFQLQFVSRKINLYGSVGIDSIQVWESFIPTTSTTVPTTSTSPNTRETTTAPETTTHLRSTTRSTTTSRTTTPSSTTSSTTKHLPIMTTAPRTKPRVILPTVTLPSNVAELCGVHNPHTLPQGCDFGMDFCNYTHQPDAVWLRSNARYPSGFAIGHNPVSPNGTFAVPNFVHFNSFINDDIATLTSPPINSGVICVEFLYSLQGRFSNLDVLVGNTSLWQAPPYSSTQWTTHNLAVNSSGPFQLQFVSRKFNVYGSVGIDSIQVWESFIPTTSTAVPTTSTSPNTRETTTAPDTTTNSSVTPPTTRSTTSRTTTPSSTVTLSTTASTTKPPPITTTAPPTTPPALPATPTGIVPQVTIPSNGSRLHQITNADDFCRTGGQRRLLPQSCTFDSDFCNFTYDQHESHPWELQKGSYSGLFTSIKASSNGTYVRKEFQFGGGQNPTSSLRTSVPEGDICVDFLYYLYGTTSNLRVVTTTPSDSLVVWNSTGKPTNSWGRAVVAVNSAEPVQLAFTTMKVDFRSLVGIDNISIWKIAP